MIQPVKSGRELLAEIDEAAGAVPKLWWLGQSGFAVRCGDAVLYLDPYLSESLTAKYKDTDRPHIRMTACPLDPSAVTHAGLVLCTHKHSDHLDPGTVPLILGASPRSKVVLPRAHVEHAKRMGIAKDRMIPVDAGERLERGKIVIEAIPSAHEELDWTSENGYPHLGYVIRFGGEVIYHSGDCIPYNGLVEKLRPRRVTIALLPINGRDPKRGVAGNFSIEEAGALAEEIGARWLIPMHYDMFTFNTVEVGLFEEHMRSRHPGQRFKVMQCGEGWSAPAE